MAATDTPKNLGEKVKTALFGGKIRKGESGIGLNYTNSGKMGQIEPASDGLGAN